MSEEKLEEKHESDLTKKEKRLLERKKLKGMSFWKKLEYIWMYYKPAIFGTIGFVILIFIGMDLYENAKMETLVSISVVNAGGSDTEAFAEQVKEIVGTTGKYETVEVSSSMNTGSDGKTLDYYAQMAFVTQIQAKTVDILVIPEPFYEELNQEGYFADLQEILGEETYASFGENIDQHHLKLENGEAVGEGISLAYEPVCIAVMVNAPNPEHAAEWITSLAE